VAVEDDERGRPFVARKIEGVLDAVESLASPTRKTFHPYARKRAATSSVKARLVCPSIVMWLLS